MRSSISAATSCGTPTATDTGNRWERFVSLSSRVWARPPASGIHLANRAGSALELKPLTAASDLGEFKGFCLGLEAEMLRLSLVRHTGLLSTGKGQRTLLEWSGGYIGRVCRIVAQALEHATLRCATAVEKQDLDYAIQNFAIPNNYHSV